MKTTIQEPSVTETKATLYGIYDNACGVLVDRHCDEAGEFTYEPKILTNEEVLVVDSVFTHDDRKVWYEDIKDAQHVKWLLEQENPTYSYTVVSFTKCVYEFYKFETVE